MFHRVYTIPVFHKVLLSHRHSLAFVTYHYCCFPLFCAVHKCGNYMHFADNSSTSITQRNERLKVFVLIWQPHCCLYCLQYHCLGKYHKFAHICFARDRALMGCSSCNVVHLPFYDLTDWHTNCVCFP